jgi:hypothetical protein
MKIVLTDCIAAAICGVTFGIISFLVCAWLDPANAVSTGEIIAAVVFVCCLLAFMFIQGAYSGEEG